MRSEAATLVDVLRSWAARRPEQTALTFLEDGESPGHTLTYEALDQRAQEIAAGIRETVGPGERALLLYPPGLEFVTAFVGCLYAGVVPVPLYPPRNPRHFPRIDAIVADAEAGCVLTESDLHGRLSAWLEGRARLEGRSARLPLVCTNRVAAGPPTNPWAPQSDITPETLALLQYTSGSTSEPKGVMVSHGNLMANQRMIRQTFGHAEGLVAVSWLPVYHDMGLIGSLMQPLYLGGHCILMAPAAFLQKPRRWLAAISEFRAQSSGGPNFALRLCTRAIQGEQKAGLDLSGLDVLFCGSEPINASDLRAFTDAFRETGFRREAICCCYGMAEATLLVTASAPGSGPAFEPVDAEALSANVAITVATSTGQDPRRGHREVVGCGRAADGVEVVIVDHGGVDPNRTADAGGRDEHRALEDGRIGEIWLRGSHVARGYWRKPDLTRDTFEARLRGAPPSDAGPYLRTGDLGFLRHGELFVTGRMKDLIIIRGRNHYPQDVESTVRNCHPSFQGHDGAAFSESIDGQEGLVVIQEIGRHHHHDAETAVGAIRVAVAEAHEIAPSVVVLVRQGGVPKTSSGKIQRSACARAYVDGRLPVVFVWTDASAVHASGTAESVVDAPGSVDVGRPRSREDIENFLVERLSKGLAVSPDDVDLSQPFSALGLDSLRAVELVKDVESWIGRSLSPTVFWDYPTIAHLAGHLADARSESVALLDEARG